MPVEKKSLGCYAEDHATATKLADEHGYSMPQLVRMMVARMAQALADVPTVAEQRAQVERALGLATPRGTRAGARSPRASSTHATSDDDGHAPTPADANGHAGEVAVGELGAGS